MSRPVYIDSRGRHVKNEFKVNKFEEFYFALFNTEKNNKTSNLHTVLICIGRFNLQKSICYPWSPNFPHINISLEEELVVNSSP